MDERRARVPFRRELAAFLIVAMGAAGALGCASGQRHRATRPLNVSGAPPVTPNATVAPWTADVDRLVSDIPRAVARMHWGLLHCRRVQTATRPGKSVVLIEAAALLPDGREAQIVVVQEEGGREALSGRPEIRVGRFGDPALERGYLRSLDHVLRGRSVRKRGGGFELP